MWAAEPSFTPEQLQSIKAPTLIIVGDEDIVTPEHAVEMFRTIPGAQLCVVPHAGHGVVAEGDGPDVPSGSSHRREVAGRARQATLPHTRAAEGRLHIQGPHWRLEFRGGSVLASHTAVSSIRFCVVSMALPTSCSVTAVPSINAAHPPRPATPSALQLPSVHTSVFMGAQYS